MKAGISASNFLQVTINGNSQLQAYFIIPEGLHVYRNKFYRRIYDPNRGRIAMCLVGFYTHTTSVRSRIHSYVA